MKILVTCLLLTAVLFPVNGSAHGGPLKWSNATAIEVVFDRQMDFDDVVRLREEMEAQGIELFYTRLEFDDLGKLLSIAITVSADGHRGSASADLEPGRDDFGFIVDRTEGARIPFAVGNFRK